MSAGIPIERGRHGDAHLDDGVDLVRRGQPDQQALTQQFTCLVDVSEGVRRDPLDARRDLLRDYSLRVEDRLIVAHRLRALEYPLGQCVLWQQHTAARKRRAHSSR